MMNYQTAMVTMYPSVRATEGKDAELGKVLAAIRNGKWREQVEAHRNGQSTDLPAFTGSATFVKRNKDMVETYNGVVIMDFDHVSIHPSDLSTDPFVAFAFRSRSGDGLAVGILNGNGQKHHEATYRHASEYFFQKYQMEADDACKDVSRLRFVSYDPDMVIKDASEFTYKPYDYHDDREQGQGAFYTVQENLAFAERTISKTETYFEGNRHNYIFKLACMCNRLGVPKSELESYVRVQYPDFMDTPTNAISWTYKSYRNEHGSRRARKRARRPQDIADGYRPQNVDKVQGGGITARVGAIYKIEDEMQEYLDDFGQGPILLDGLGFSMQFDMSWKYMDGQMTAILASANSGKTTFILNIIAHLAANRGKKIGIFSPEQDAPPIINGRRVPLKKFLIDALAPILIGKPLGAIRHHRDVEVHAMKKNEFELALKFINDNFVFITPGTDERDFASVMGYSQHAVETYKVDCVVIDPWNMINDSIGEWQDLADKIRVMRDFARSGPHVMVSNHTSKSSVGEEFSTGFDGVKEQVERMPSLYGMKGGTEWKDMSDNGIVLMRPKHVQGKELVTKVKTDKIRFQGVNGILNTLELNFNPSNNRFYEVEPDYTSLI